MIAVTSSKILFLMLTKLWELLAAQLQMLQSWLSL